MARANITITPAPGIGAGVEAVSTAGNATTDHKLLNAIGSRVILIVENAQAAATVEVTLHGVDSGDDIVKTIPALKTYCFGPLPASLYTQPSGTDVGYVEVDLDVDTSVTLRAFSY